MEERINNIFETLGQYDKSYDRLSVKQIIDLIKELTSIRHGRNNSSLERNEKLLQLEKDLRFVKAKMIETNQQVLTR